MGLLRSFSQSWVRICLAARREFLRDPDVLLFERLPEPAVPLIGESVHER